MIILTIVELVIGFIDSPYQANERDTFVTVDFGILSGGMTQTNIVVELFTTDLTALSEFLLHSDAEIMQSLLF